MNRPHVVLLVSCVIALSGCKPTPDATVDKADAAPEKGEAKAPAKAAIPGDLDLVILNGRVMDPETKLDAVRNVGVKDGKIVAVTEAAIEGKETIDASGHVVAPGFIDTHSHNVSSPFGQKLALRDGIATALEIEAGVYPVDLWYGHWESKSQTNFGATVSVMNIREILFNPDYKPRDPAVNGAAICGLLDPIDSHATMAWSTQVATGEQIEQMKSMLDEGLKQGALGVGHTPGYEEFGITTRESVLAQQMAGKYGRLVGMHGRFSSQQPPTSGLLGTAEQLAAVAAHGGGLIVQHMTAQCLALSADCQALLDAAYAKGHQTIAEIYAYTYGATIVGADYLKPDNYQKNMGRTYSDIVEVATGKPLTKARYEKLVKTAPSTSVTFVNASKEDLYKALAHPTSTIGSDSFPYVMKADGSPATDWDTPFDAVNGHPRGAATYARILQLVREENLMPLMLAISKMTYMPAKFLQDNGVARMANKGRIQEGADADITIFDPATVKANATPKDGGLPSTGIPYVVVNGTVIVKDSKVLKDVYPGRPIRNAAQN
jgi:N-acyl-D-glutamate deacylase